MPLSDATIQQVLDLADKDGTLLLAVEWNKVIEEIGNTNSDAELIASVLLAQQRILAKRK